MNLPVYLDHAATTPVAPEVVEAMLPYFTEYYGNPSAIHSLGLAAREAVENAREIVAEGLNASPEEIVFTSGGTESDNMALRGLAEANRSKGRHLLSTPIEHHAVLETLETLAHHHDYELEMIPVDGDGLVDPEEVAKRLRADTVLVSVMHANNEIGTVEPITEIGALCRRRGVFFHTDAVQTFGKLPLDVRAMNIDLLSLTAHKFYGPKGIGALYIRRGVPVARFQEGGEQERGRRGGTLNVPGIVGVGKASELALSQLQTEAKRLTALRDCFFNQIQERIPGVRINGSRTHRLPFNIHLCIEGVQGESILLALDAAGICSSAGSACTAGSTEPSHVLKAIGISRDLALSALRLTMGHSTTQESLDYAMNILVKAVSDFRRLLA
jgi:cysteine desulfurase